MDTDSMTDMTEMLYMRQKQPVMDGLMKDYPFVKGNASGLAVGLPDGQMGNSEVGHMNMGAGRIVYQELTRITKEIQDQIFEALAWLEGVNGKKFGDTEDPLLVSVRSGARASMPGMMDTILNLGLNEEVVHVLAKKSGQSKMGLGLLQTIYPDVFRCRYGSGQEVF